MKEDGCPIIKYIDLSTATRVNPTASVKTETEMTSQFASILGVIRSVFGWIKDIDKITDALSKTNTVGKQYSDVVSEITVALNALKTFIEQNPDKVYGDEDDNPPPIKKTKINSKLIEMSMGLGEMRRGLGEMGSVPKPNFNLF